MGKLFEETADKFKSYVMPTYSPQIMFVRGKDTRLWDDDGNEYLDFASGIAVCSLGHCNERVTRAIQEQCGKLVHISNLYMNELMPELARRLAANAMPGSKVFFCNSGAEANEGMIKLARKYGNKTGRNHIISMDNSFHGRTLATLAATGRAKYRKGFEPDMPGFSQVPFNDFDALKAAVNDDTCAVMLEMLQGEGGVFPADREYLKKVRALCDEKDILLLCDEVQCGMGRLGTRFAYQKFGIEPDVLTMAKAIANGFPMGAIVAGKKCADVFEVGNHASTFGGTPLACAAALAVQDAFDQDGVLENCEKEGEFLRAELSRIAEKYEFIKTVRGMGLMIGMVLDRPAGGLASLLLKDKMVALTAGETVLRLVPPLTITREDSELAIAKIAKAVEEFAKQEGLK